MIEAKDLLLAGFDNIAISEEHSGPNGEGGIAGILAAGLPPETAMIAKVNAAGYPEQLIRLTESGMPYGKALLSIVAAAYIEGAIAAARAVRAEGGDE